ncbi:hypothetical protein GYMLUDRAFT_45529 [Collybiopsis luxurians FD-317 M1]|uniref:Unplaced genomic scaffold GYMLUscaffold_38, whole genome shotgun sequence n=1 Tax=Collybiopsis luxurians FD-317 M1 TaxID=944289 RepID=A0A0D0B4R1_9AGAR|nr:hypothetical protein GYMLUDRAFT_45529 [Collybiopsis luxurians FD-317 M1]
MARRRRMRSNLVAVGGPAGYAPNTGRTSLFSGGGGLFGKNNYNQDARPVEAGSAQYQYGNNAYPSYAGQTGGGFGGSNLNQAPAAAAAPPPYKEDTSNYPPPPGPPPAAHTAALR